MRAALDDLPLIHHDDLVGMADGFEPVGYHDNGLLPRQLRYCLHQLLFILWIDIFRGLVENDYLSFMPFIIILSKAFSPSSLQTGSCHATDFA